MVDSKLGPSDAVRGCWPKLQQDIERLSDEYESEGWSTIQIPIGDVTPLGSNSDRPAVLEIVVPSDTLGEIERVVGEDEVDRFDVYQQNIDSDVLLVVVLLNSTAETALMYPVFYQVMEARPMLDKADAEGTIWTRFRNLEDDDEVVIEHDSPNLFMPN